MLFFKEFQEFWICPEVLGHHVRDGRSTTAIHSTLHMHLLCFMSKGSDKDYDEGGWGFGI